MASLDPSERLINPQISLKNPVWFLVAVSLWRSRRLHCYPTPAQTYTTQEYGNHCPTPSPLNSICQQVPHSALPANSTLPFTLSLLIWGEKGDASACLAAITKSQCLCPAMSTTFKSYAHPPHKAGIGFFCLRLGTSRRERAPADKVVKMKPPIIASRASHLSCSFRVPLLPQSVPELRKWVVPHWPH